MVEMDQDIGVSMSKSFETPSDLVVSAFCRAASTWNLHPPEGYTARMSVSNVYPPINLTSSSTDGFELSVRILQIFDEKLIFYVKRATDSRSLQITISEFFKQATVLLELDSAAVQKKLEQRFSLALFAPLLQPQSIQPALPMLPTTPLLHIFSYLSAQELCRVGQVTKSLTAVSNSEEVWRELVAKDFAVMSLAAPLGPIVTAPPPAMTGPSTATAPGIATTERSAKDTYRYHHQQKLAALRRERYLQDAQTAQAAQWDEWVRQQRAGYGAQGEWGWGPYNGSGSQWIDEPWLPSLRLPMPGQAPPSVQNGPYVPGFGPPGTGWSDYEDVWY